MVYKTDPIQLAYKRLDIEIFIIFNEQDEIAGQILTIYGRSSWWLPLRERRKFHWIQSCIHENSSNQ